MNVKVKVNKLLHVMDSRYIDSAILNKHDIFNPHMSKIKQPSLNVITLFKLYSCIAALL